MSEAQRLGQILVQPKRACDGAANLGDLKTMGQADAVMIAIGCNEYLRLVTQPTEGDRMNNPVAITLEDIARPPRFPAGLGIEPPTAGFRIAGIGCAVVHGHSALHQRR